MEGGPLRMDDEGRWYMDFFRVITDMQVIFDWKGVLKQLKAAFGGFQRDILLAHHHHRHQASSSYFKPTFPPYPDTDHARLVGQISFAHDGPILEAINLALNPLETHYIDRCLSATGALTIIITPGTGHFRVSRRLLRLTTTRVLDQGFVLHLVSLAKPPLHQSPIFSFGGYKPGSGSGSDVNRQENGGKLGGGGREFDPLWGGGEGGDDDDDVGEKGKERAGSRSETRTKTKTKTTFWWEPFWMSVSFWDKQMDMPFREDRYV